ncbi:MAG TPA: efflux RND transporter periplasmic adaptor subunit [Bacteroidales bacterium]|nr:efflux RND transporter periplasmic adaptor subunit [Bacteroidales bacterium]
MKKKVLIIGAVVVVLAVIALLVFKPFGKKDAEATFDTVKVEKGKITNTVTATGTIVAVTSVEVGTQVSGIIDKIYVDFNDQVKKGQMLAQIDKTTLLAQLEQSRSTVDQAQANMVFQEATYNRLKVLFEKKLIAQSDYDQALYNHENARASLKNAKSAYDRNLTNLNYSTIASPIDGVVLNRAVEEGQTVAASFNTPTLFTIVNDLTQMEVETSVDEADIGKVQQEQRVEFTVDAYSDLKFEGKVSEVRLQPTTTNNVVTYSVILSAPNPDKKLMPGMTASATIYVDEKDNTLILSGKAMRFTPDMAYMEKMMAKMMQDTSAGSRPKRMPSGMPSQGSAMAATGDQTAAGQAVPSEAMPQMPQGGFGSFSAPDGSKMVWVKDEKGGIRPNRVIVGIDNGNSVEILSGLKEGDEVIISMSSSDPESNTSDQNQGPRGPFPF